MGWMTRRRFLWLAGGGTLGVVGLRFAFPRWLRPGAIRGLDAELAAFVDEIFAGIDRARCWDAHVHVVGLGAGGTGCWINPQMRSHLHPVKRLQYDVYTSALGMQDEATADADYVKRLADLSFQANPQGKLVLFAFDQRVDRAGVEQPNHSPLFTPNDYVLRLAEQHPGWFPCVSIHPYRADAVERLIEAAERGAVAVKWLPNSMGIDPLSSTCDPFYEKLVELDLPLIAHTGEEYAVDTLEDQEWGNPLRLRRPLDHGVRVVAAHCASLGSSRDLDRPEDGASQPCFDLLMRLMREPRYETNLFADISALTQLNRGQRILEAVLTAEWLHPRLVNGSDYPLPALRIIYSTRLLEWSGFLDARARRLCNRLADINPLLFDFALKRSLRVERDDGVFRFPNRVFESAWLFATSPSPTPPG